MVNYCYFFWIWNMKRQQRHCLVDIHTFLFCNFKKLILLSLLYARVCLVACVCEYIQGCVSFIYNNFLKLHTPFQHIKHHKMRLCHDSSKVQTAEKTNHIKVKVNFILCSFILPMKRFTFFWSGKGSHWARRWWKKMEKLNPQDCDYSKTYKSFSYSFCVDTKCRTIDSMLPLFPSLFFIYFILEYILNIAGAQRLERKERRENWNNNWMKKKFESMIKRISSGIFFRSSCKIT